MLVAFKGFLGLNSAGSWGFQEFSPFFQVPFEPFKFMLPREGRRTRERGGPRIRDYLLKILLEDPKRVESERDRTQVRFRGELQKDGFVIRGAVGEDFGRGQHSG